MKKFLIGASVAALLAVPALAIQHEGMKGHGMQGPQTRAQVQAMVQQHFALIDANRDGAVTQAEFDAGKQKMQAEREAMRAKRHAEHFTRMDANKDGQLSRAEFDAAHAQRMGEHRGMGGHDGMGMGDHDMKMGGHGMGMGGHGMKMGGMAFADVDANKDGRVTLAEASAKALAWFDRIDANKDGTVTPEERKAARGAMREEHKAHQ